MATLDEIKTDITKYYQNILQRDPSDDEVNSWAAPVTSGALSMEQVKAAFINSPEAQNVHAVTRLYQAAFGRVPDPEGLKNWVNTGLSMDEIADGFVGSQEFINRYGSGNVSEAFVTSLYYQVLGRAPDADGLKSWMASGKSAAQIMTGFSESIEFKAKTATATYTFLDNAAKGEEDYSGSLNDYMPQPEPEPEVLGQTYTLTVNADDLTGTAGDDIFVANQVAPSLFGFTTDTLTNSDLLDGGAGNDTLRATIGADVDIASTSIETVQIRNIATGPVTVNIADDVTALVEAKSIAGNDITFTGAKAVNSVTSGGKANLSVSGMEAAAVSVNVAKAANTITLGSASAKTTALTDLSVNFAGALTVAANNDLLADTVTKLAVKANGNGVYSKDADENTADSLTFEDSDKLTSVVVTGQGDLELNLGDQTKMATFDAWGLAGGVKTTLSSTVLTSVEGGDGSDILTVTALKDGGKVELLGGDDTLTLTAAGGYTVDGGAGDDTISANVMTGKTTVINAGEGADKVTVTVPDYTSATTKLTVAMGAGDDFLDAGNLNGITSGFNFDGGEGTDTIRITGDLALTQANRISGFDVIDLSGNSAGNIDMSREPAFKSIALDASATDAANTNASITNAAAGTGITVSGHKDEASSSAGELTYSLADATGTSDSVSVSLMAVDGGTDGGLAQGQVSFGLTANEIETVNVVSTATVDVGDATAAPPIPALKASAYSNSFTLVGDSVKTVTVGGDAKATLIIADAADKLETINATGNTGGVTVTLANTGVTFNGGAGNDDVSSTLGGAVIHGGAGADSYSLGQVADVKDTIVFKAASDSMLAIETDADTAVESVDFSGMDMIQSFGANDVMDLTAFGFTGSRAGTFVDKTSSVTGADYLLTLVKEGGANFFQDGSVDRGVAKFSFAGDTVLAIDANKDGDFNAGSDLVVGLVGVSTIDNTNVIFSA